MLSRISDLSDQDLESLEGQIVGEFETDEGQELSKQVVDTLEGLATAGESVRSERTRRAQEQAALAQQAAEASARVHENSVDEEAPAEEAPETESPEEDAGEPADAEVTEEEDKKPEPPVFSTETKLSTDSAVETPTELSAAEPNITTEPAIVQENVEAPVTAAADLGIEPQIEVPAGHQPVEKASAAVTITAGADIPGITAGSPMNSMGAVAEAFVKRLHGLRRVNGGDGEQHTVATLNVTLPEDRMLSGDPESNWAKIQAVTSPQALVASGGYCAPLEVRYEVYSLGTTARPVRDSLARFGADRGGLRFVEPPVLADYSGAVGIWTAANDAAENPSPATKSTLVVECGSEVTAVADAVTMSLQFGNLATRAYPEMIARHNELALIQHAREAEQNLLTQIASLGTALTASKVLGVARDFLVQLDRAAAAYRYRHRLELTAPLRVIAPGWVKDAIRADLAMQIAGEDTYAVADAKINGFFSARNINVTWSLDGVPGFSAEVASSALDEFPATFQWDLFSEGTFLFLDGGTLDLGIIRDSTLVGTNDYKMFVETFEGVAKVGVESLHVTSTFSVTGEAQAAIDAVTS